MGLLRSVEVKEGFTEGEAGCRPTPDEESEKGRGRVDQAGKWLVSEG